MLRVEYAGIQVRGLLFWGKCEKETTANAGAGASVRSGGGGPARLAPWNSLLGSMAWGQ